MHLSKTFFLSMLSAFVRGILVSRFANQWPVRRLIREIELFVLTRHGKWLFDEDYYKEVNSDVVGQEVDAIRHYIFHGSQEGRNPSLYFDTIFYQNRYIAGSGLSINPLVHFLIVGRSKRLSPSVWFDYSKYLSANSDVRIAGIDPYRHFVEYGVLENRVASTAFDPDYYLECHLDVGASGMPALEHYLRYGEGEERQAVSYLRQTRSRIAGDNQGPTICFEKAILALPPASIKGRRKLRKNEANRIVDVIIPVYRGREETLSCLWHVLRAKNKTRFEVVVVDDKSPEHELSAALARLAGAGCITLLVNDNNEGFVKSVNRGMRLHPDRDVILLNSDTEVYGDWIDRLNSSACACETCGTITPLTNSGTICSYPNFVQDNSVPLEISYEEIDNIASVKNAGEVIKAPTAVGFCMFIKRRALESVGYFDEEAFGTGYGEENDFCLRAQAVGFVDLVAADVFVRHLGSMSFQGMKSQRVANALKVISERYPDYNLDVQRFIRADPLRPLRGRIDLARLGLLKRRRNILIISHERGGGTEQHVLEETARLSDETTSVFRMAADMSSTGRVWHFHADAPDVPSVPTFDLKTETSQIIKLWDELCIDEVHVHHVGDFGASGASRVAALLIEAKRPWRVVVHDYLAICPRINLSDGNGYYCGEPDESGCAACLKYRRSQYGVPNIGVWREGHSCLLMGATSVIVPNEDVSTRLLRYFPDLRIEVRPHESIEIAPLNIRPHRPGTPIRIGTVGAISKTKGFDILVASAQDAARRNLPLEFVVVGYTENDARARSVGIKVTGPYVNNRVLDIIDENEIDIIFLGSTVPETFSYTTSFALKSCLPIIALDVGAVSSRLMGVGRVLLLDLAEIRKNNYLNDAILKVAEEFYGLGKS